MYTTISVFIVIVSILLILIVLVQNPKGGGLSSTFAGSNQIMGVRKTADFLEKSTWTLAVSLVILSFLATLSMPDRNTKEPQSVMESRVNEMPSPDATPTFPMPTQENQPTDTAK